MVRCRGCRDGDVVTNVLRIGLRWVYILTVALSAAYVLSHGARRTEWFKDRMYQQLLTGDEDQRLRAVSVLADVGAESHLLRGLRSEDEGVSEMARRGLDHLWFHAAGRDAYERMETAYSLAEDRKYAESMKVLDQLLSRYPDYVEALNRRAAAAWQLGDYEKSRQDCERALKLNPNHYGAWQGLGVAQLQIGDLAAASRSLRTALRISPNDKVAQRCLKKVEDLMRKMPGQSAPPREADLL